MWWEKIKKNCEEKVKINKTVLFMELKKIKKMYVYQC